MDTQRLSTPNPDPTKLTTDQLVREMGMLRELLEQQINGVKSSLDTRLDDMDKAADLVQKLIDRRPAEMELKVGHLREVHDEKFHSIQTQFTERDVRTEQTARDSKVAVDAALQAAKEAVAEQNRSSALSITKSETATMKQIDQQGLLIVATKEALTVMINDVKDRLIALEAEKRGAGKQEQHQQASSAAILGIVGLIVGSVIGVGGLVVAMMRTPAPVVEVIEKKPAQTLLHQRGQPPVVRIIHAGEDYFPEDGNWVGKPKIVLCRKYAANAVMDLETLRQYPNFNVSNNNQWLTKKLEEWKKNDQPVKDFRELVFTNCMGGKEI